VLLISSTNHLVLAFSSLLERKAEYMVVSRKSGPPKQGVSYVKCRS
jgi:hypothetical protein